MQEQHLFEYAIIRVVPHVEREEFLNAGVILYCAAQKFLKCLTLVDEPRLKVLCNSIDIDELREYFQAFERICSGGEGSGPIGKLSMPERFRWLTSPRSTVVQTSSVHPGLCSDPEEKLKSLFLQLVERSGDISPDEEHETNSGK